MDSQLLSAALILNQLADGRCALSDAPLLPNKTRNEAVATLEAAIRKVATSYRNLERTKTVDGTPDGTPDALTPPAEFLPVAEYHGNGHSNTSSPILSHVTFSDGSTQSISGSRQMVIGTETVDYIGMQSQVRLLNDQLFVLQKERVAAAHEHGAIVASLEQELAKSRQDIEDFLEALRTISEVTKSVAKGDLSQKINIQAKGVEILELKSVINAMVDRLRSFASQVTRVATEVGTEGILGGQAELPDVEGTWLELTTSVNEMASNLTIQVRSIAEVTTAVAQGDLSKEVEVDAKGEVLALKNTINSMVYSLRDFADQVSRVAREVGTEGRLGGQAHIEGVSGCWRELSDNVNTMASNLTNQVRGIAEVTTAVARGDLTKQVEVDAQGEIKDLKITINSMVNSLVNFSSEVTRVSREVGTEGILGGQANVDGAEGTWKLLVSNVNKMAANLTAQVRSIAHVTTAVAMGDLSTKIEVPAQGEILQLKNTINDMVDRLQRFSAEVTRVAREVGTEGILGSQAHVQYLEGDWLSLQQNVNQMAANLTSQVREIAEVTTAVALGDLDRKITVHAEGEILELKQTINRMVDRLQVFAFEVSRVAKEVGVEGKLGVQAEVADVHGLWKQITSNVNTMASNLTSQVRAFDNISASAIDGDFSRFITVEASGEMDRLKGQINRMVQGLRDSIQKNTQAREAAEIANKAKSEFLGKIDR